MSETIKLIIEISKDTYTRLFDNGIQDNEIAVNDVGEIARALRIGKPLPKGHGRLIDADNIKNYFSDKEGDDFMVFHFYDAIDDVPTIIEADKENED